MADVKSAFLFSFAPKTRPWELNVHLVNNVWPVVCAAARVDPKTNTSTLFLTFGDAKDEEVAVVGTCRDAARSFEIRCRGQGIKGNITFHHRMCGSTSTIDAFINDEFHTKDKDRQLSCVPQTA